MREGRPQAHSLVVGVVLVCWPNLAAQKRPALQSVPAHRATVVNGDHHVRLAQQALANDRSRARHGIQRRQEAHAGPRHRRSRRGRQR